jgi:signal transduction histidine kinase/PAS domain-containing protein
MQERDKNSIEIALRERVKELQCLYAISSELEFSKNINEAIKKSIQHIIDGFQFPDITLVSIRIDDIIFGESPDACKEKEKCLKHTIAVDGKIRGEICIWYKRDAEFLEEEKNLIKEIANKVSMAIEKQDLKDELEKNVKKLEVLVRDKTKEVEESYRKNKALKELTEALERSKKKLQTFFNAITDIIVVIDPDFNVIMSNKADIESNTKCYSDIFHKDMICDFCPAQETFKKKKSTTVEIKIDSKYFLLQSYPIINQNGEVERVLGKYSDISKEKRIEKHLVQSYKLASLGKLVAGIAHEINNPNTFIRGNLNIIRESMKDILPIIDEYFKNNKEKKIARLDYKTFRENIPVLLDDMIHGVDRIKNIVDGLRNFARKNEGIMEDDININSIIKNSLHLVENRIRRRAKIKLILAEDLPILKGNIQKLEQVVVNMLINASQAIEGNNGLITIETGIDDNDAEVFIKIIDNGRGIEEKNKKYIFDPFYTTKRDSGGTGLGLSISYGIIKEHRGRIEVESSLKKGTTFTIFIPTGQVKNS